MELIVKVGDHETVVSENVLLETDYGTSCYGFKFDERCAGWSENRETNVYFLRYQQNYANELLRTRGHLFLNEVYDMLGAPRTKLGQVCGWVYKENNPIGDNYVDLDIFNDRNTEDNNVFILDPNVDGCILDDM